MGGDHMTEEASGRDTINAFKLESSPHKKRATFTDHVTAPVRPGRGYAPSGRVFQDIADFVAVDIDDSIKSVGAVVRPAALAPRTGIGPVVCSELSRCGGKQRRRGPGVGGGLNSDSRR